MKKKFEVTARESGMKLLAFLREKWPGAPSVKALKRAIDGKKCTINGRIETFSTHSLSKGDRVEIELVEPRLLFPSILYEDNEIILCNKPAGMVSENKNFPALLVHRLDKETSGVLILAKTEVIRQKMIPLFAAHLVKKEYLALVDGKVLKTEGKIENRLTKKRSYQGQTIYASSSEGEEAITHWKCLGVGKKESLVWCEPVTGRTHQLRVHLKEMGHPILGDTQYAKKFSSTLPVFRQMLHAYRISFPHPETNRSMKITAPLPDDFLQALKVVGIVI